MTTEHQRVRAMIRTWKFWISLSTLGAGFIPPINWLSWACWACVLVNMLIWYLHVLFAALQHIEAQDKRIAELEDELLKLAAASTKVGE